MILPAVARYWDVLEGGTVYRFYIRSSARYWNGDQVKASDFRDAWFELIKPEKKTPYSSLLDVVKGVYEYRTGKTTDRSTVGIKADSDGVLEVELKSPAEHFLKILCHHSFVPLHPSLLSKKDWKEERILPGNGPFYVLETDMESITLTKNRLYWDSKNVQLDGIRLVFSDDPEYLASEFNTEALHWAAGTFSLDALKNPDYLVINPMFSTYYFFFSSRMEPFADPEIRMALSLLIPWEEVRSKDYLILPSEVLVPALSGYPRLEGISKADRSKALDILSSRDIGRESGLRPVIKIPRGPETKRVAELIKKHGRKLEVWKWKSGSLTTIHIIGTEKG